MIYTILVFNSISAIYLIVATYAFIWAVTALNRMYVGRRTNKIIRELKKRQVTLNNNNQIQIIMKIANV